MKTAAQLVTEIADGLAAAWEALAVLRKMVDEAPAPVSATPAPVRETKAPKPETVDRRKERAKVSDYRGEKVSIQDLAALAGCSYAAMHGRLTKHGCTPEEAVNFKPARRAAAPLPVKAATTAAPVSITAAPLVLAKDAEPVIPEGLVPDVRKTPPGRFDVTSAEPVFGAMKPGQYLDGGAPWVRAYTGPRR